MEKDRQLRRIGRNALAPPWWRSFGFELEDKIEDKVSSMIFGAIFKFKPVRGRKGNQSVKNSPPSYVVALRGTIPKVIKDNIFTMVRSMHTTMRDIWDNLRILINKLHESSRFNLTREKVAQLVKSFGPGRVWLAGHSLGSASALLIGKEMARSGFLLETYLFNPPFVSLPMEHIGVPSPLSHGIRTASSFARAGFTTFLCVLNNRPMVDRGFMALSTWVPHIFVSPNDAICSGFIGYFQHRTRMEAIGLGQLEKIATQNSYTSLISDGLRLKGDLPADTLPSARLVINRKQYTSTKAAHKLREWWDLGIRCESKEYQLKT